MKKKPLSFLSLGSVLLILGCSPSCRISPQNVPAEVVSATESAEKLSSFVLKEEFWVYRYSKPIATFTNGDEDVVYRMTAATGTAIGGRRLADYYREYWDTLHVGTQIRIIGVTRYKDGRAYIVRVEGPRETRLGNALIEIYDEADNYAVDQLLGGLPKLNEAYFQRMED